MSKPNLLLGEYSAGTIGFSVKRETSLTTEEIANIIGVKEILLKKVFRGEHPLTKKICQGLCEITNKKPNYWKRIDFNIWGISGF